MSNFERDMANTMLDAADARIASLEADKADLLRVLGIADEKIRSGEDARGQYIRENAALEARCGFAEGEASLYMGVSVKRAERIAELEAALREILADRIAVECSMGMGTDWTEKVDRLLAPSTSETPAAMHSRIVTETADAAEGKP